MALLAATLSVTCCGPDQETRRPKIGPGYAWERTLAVDLEPIAVAAAVSRRVETQGLTTALLERRLGAIEGVLPRVGGVAVRPGLAHSVLPAETWTLQVGVEGAGDVIDLRSTLCDPERRCESVTHAGSRVALGEPVGRAVLWVADLLDRRVLGGSQGWAQPESADDYAVLITGRAAATVYGLQPPVAAEHLGDRMRDPLARAVYLDPAMPTAWFLRARSDLSGSLGQRQADAERALSQDPADPLLLADAAALALASGDATTALRGFEELSGRAPRDLRFALPLAEAGLAAGATEVTRRAVARLRSVPAADAERLSLEVRLAEATGTVDTLALEGLLTEWQRVDLDDPDPVQRRIDQRVLDGDYSGALALLPELAARAPGPSTLATELALASAVERWDQAAEAADRLGDDEVHAALRALGLAAQPAAAAAWLAGQTSPELSAARGLLLLSDQQPEAALAAADQALAQDPEFAEGHALRVAALTSLGREIELAAARQALAHLDPAQTAVDPPDRATALTTLLAPGPAHLAGAIDQGLRQLAQAAAVGGALARVQNEWQGLAPSRIDCSRRDVVDLAARSEALGAGWRVRLQGAAAARKRAERLRQARTLRPLVRDRVDQALAELSAGVRAETTRYLVSLRAQLAGASTWQARCAGPLVTAPGLANRAPQARKELQRGVAVLATGGGRICPSREAAVGQVVVLPVDSACWTADDCADCVLAPVEPAAVLGPPAAPGTP